MIPVFHIFVFFTCGSKELFVSGVLYHSTSFCVVAVQLLSCIQLFATPWTPARQSSLSFPVFWSLLMSIIYGQVHKYMQLILEQHWFGLLGSTFMQISSSNDIVLPLIPIHGFHVCKFNQLQIKIFACLCLNPSMQILHLRMWRADFGTWVPWSFAVHGVPGSSPSTDTAGL